MAAELDGELQKLFSQAVTFHQQGRLQEAAHRYQLILQHQPAHADSQHLLGVLAHQSGNNESAAVLIAQAINLNPGQAPYHYNLGKVYQAEGRLPEAVNCYRQSLKLKPDNAEAWSNLGVAYQDQGLLSQAMQAYKQACKLPTDNSDAMYNYATLLMHNASNGEAEDNFKKFIMRRPMHADARGKLAQLRLQRGDFKAGWAGFHWRAFATFFTTANPLRVVPFAVWCGQPLQGRTLLLLADLGVGDVVMYLSCVQELIDQAERVIIECEARFVSLLHRSFPKVEILQRCGENNLHWHSGLGKIDYQSNLSDLPVYQRQALTAFPEKSAFLKADPEKISYWKNKLSELGSGLKIGISWRGGAEERSRKARSIPLKYWLPLAAVEDVKLINLQYGDCQEEIELFNKKAASPLLDFDDQNPVADLESFAALIKTLDLIISIDNSTVHFAGALGVPTWAMLPKSPEWRWQNQGEMSLWYPSVRLFRVESSAADALYKQIKVVRKELLNGLDGKLFRSSQESSKDMVDAPVIPDYPALKAFDYSSEYLLLINDSTAWGHWGFAVSSLALHESLRNKYGAVVSVPVSDIAQLTSYPGSAEYFDDDALWQQFRLNNVDLLEKISGADAIVFDGSDVFSGQLQCYTGLLYILYVAVTRMHKQVTMLNHGSYENNAGQNAELLAVYNKVLPCLDRVCVLNEQCRETLIKADVNAVQVFNSLPLFIDRCYRGKVNVNSEQEDGKYILLAGSAQWSPDVLAALTGLVRSMHDESVSVRILVGARFCLSKEDEAFVQCFLTQADMPCDVLLARSEHEWLQFVEHAALIITAFTPHAIAAAFLDTPLLVPGEIGADLHAVIALLGLDVVVNMDEPDFYDHFVHRAFEAVKQPEKLVLAPVKRAQLVELALKSLEL